MLMFLSASLTQPAARTRYLTLSKQLTNVVCFTTTFLKRKSRTCSEFLIKIQLDGTFWPSVYDNCISLWYIYIWPVWFGIFTLQAILYHILTLRYWDAWTHYYNHLKFSQSWWTFLHVNRQAGKIECRKMVKLVNRHRLKGIVSKGFAKLSVIIICWINVSKCSLHFLAKNAAFCM